ncbi:MAG: hypothetical protein U0414_27010 [Polyangiaceae bacterium]
MPVLVVTGLVIGFWWDGRQTENRLKDAWASFQMCTVGRIPDDQHPPNELRRKIELAKLVADKDKEKDGKAPKPTNELKPCATYAQTILDSLDRGEAKNAEFIKQMGRFAHPAEAATGRALGEQLDTLWAAGNNLKLVPGTADPAAPKPPIVEPAIELGGGSEVPIGAGSMPIGRLRYGASGVARRTWRIKDDFVVCDFLAGPANPFKCKKFVGMRTSTAPDAAPPLGDSMLFRSGAGGFEVSTAQGSKFVSAMTAFQSGEAAPRYTKEGTKPDTIEVYTWGPNPTLDVTVDVKDLRYPSLRLFWDKMILVAAETGGDIPAEEAWPTLFDVQPNGAKKKIARLKNNANLRGQQACKAPNATYVYIGDEADYITGDAWVITWLEGKAPTLRKINLHTTDANPPTCSEAGLVLHYGLDRLTCPPEGDCSFSTERVDSGCSDGKRTFGIETVDDALLLNVAPDSAPSDRKTTLLLDLDARGLKSTELVCGQGFAYAVLSMGTSARVLDLETDPPTFR